MTRLTSASRRGSPSTRPTGDLIHPRAWLSPERSDSASAEIFSIAVALYQRGFAIEGVVLCLWSVGAGGGSGLQGRGGALVSGGRGRLWSPGAGAGGQYRRRARANAPPNSPTAATRPRYGQF